MNTIDTFKRCDLLFFFLFWLPCSHLLIYTCLKKTVCVWWSQGCQLCLLPSKRKDAGRLFTSCPISGTGPSSGTGSWCPIGYICTMSCSSNRSGGGRNCPHDECSSSFVWRIEDGPGCHCNRPGHLRRRCRATPRPWPRRAAVGRGKSRSKLDTCPWCLRRPDCQPRKIRLAIFQNKGHGCLSRRTKSRGSSKRKGNNL